MTFEPVLYVNDPPDDGGPVTMYGFDGKIHRDRPSPSEWRQYRLRKAREKGSHTKQEWQALLAREPWCASCGRDDVSLTKDHIVPVVRGGCDCIQNIQPMCSRCNSSKCAR